MSHKYNMAGQQLGGNNMNDFVQREFDKPRMEKRFVISIVDDDEAVRESTKQLVHSLGYEPYAFASAEEFLTSEIICHTDCVITDIRMSGMSGIELQSELIASGSRLPFIFITACIQSFERARVLAPGAIGFLNKPFSDEILASYLNRALASCSS